MSTFERWLQAAAAARGEAGLVRTLRPRPAAEAVVDLASNDYLGLTRDARVVAGAVDAARTWGAGATGSRLVTGTTQLHADLEAALAELVGAPSALVTSSGYAANLAAVVALSGPDCLVVSDAANHASLVDACRLSRSRVVVVPHGSVEAFGAALAGRAEPRALVVTDGLFSVDGDVADLAALHALCRAHDAVLVVDEAHSIGVVGDGRGAVALAGLAAEPDVVTTLTLSKSLGSQGGAVLGPALVRQHLVDTARAFIFDTGLAPAAAGAALAAVRVVAAEGPALAAAVRARGLELAEVARSVGLPATHPAGAVVSVVLGDPQAALAAAATCLAHGVRVGCFRPPSVPVGTSRLRLTARADLTDADLVTVKTALAAVARPEFCHIPEGAPAVCHKPPAALRGGCDTSQGTPRVCDRTEGGGA